MNVQEWRKSKIVSGTLPSGLEIVFKKNVKIEAIFGTGDVPTPLLAMATGAANGETSNQDAVKQLPALIALADSMIKETWVSPLVTDEPTDDTVTLAEIDDGDKIAFFTYMANNLEGLGEAKSFRVKSRTNGNAPHGSEGVFNTAVVYAGNIE